MVKACSYLIIAVQSRHIRTNLGLHVEDNEANEELEEKESSEDPGVGGGETVVLTEGPAAPTHRDEEDDEIGDDEEDGDGEQPVVQEVQILSVGQLGHNPRQDQDEAEDLKIFPLRLILLVFATEKCKLGGIEFVRL